MLVPVHWQAAWHYVVVEYWIVVADTVVCPFLILPGHTNRKWLIVSVPLQSGHGLPYALPDVLFVASGSRGGHYISTAYWGRAAEMGPVFWHPRYKYGLPFHRFHPSPGINMGPVFAIPEL